MKNVFIYYFFNMEKVNRDNFATVASSNDFCVR